MLLIEKAIQSALIDHVKKAYPLAIITATANEKNYKETNQIGCVGITDILVFYNNDGVVHCLFLELKKKKGKLLPSQKDFNEFFDGNYISSNCQRAVAYGFIEARWIVDGWISFFLP